MKRREVIEITIFASIAITIAVQMSENHWEFVMWLLYGIVGALTIGIFIIFLALVIPKVKKMKKAMIKAVNIAVGIEISREEENIHLIAHFPTRIKTKRKIPMVLIKALIKAKKLTAHFRKHITIEREIPVMMLHRALIKKNEEIEYTKDNKGILIRFTEKERTYIYFAPPVNDYNLVVVPKMGFVETLKKLI